MNIGLNGIGFEPGGIGGAETYFRNLVQGLQANAGDDAFTLLCNNGNLKAVPLFDPRFRAASINLTTYSLKWYLRGILRNVTGLDTLNPAIYRCGLDLIHHPFTLRSPSCPKLPSVVTFLDMQHEYYPQFFTKSELFYRRRNYRQSARLSTRLIAISEFTKRCLVEHYGVEPGKVDVIHLGFGAEFVVIRDEARLNAVREKYRLERPFLYYPAATWPHKNHHNLLLALRILKERHGFEGELVLSGIAMQAHGAILKEIEHLGLSGSVRLLGYVAYEDLPCLYNLARMLVFPSYFEGFGLPLVEAMACGCPVVCSGVTSIPEVVGAAAGMFDPRSVEEIASAVWRVWSDQGLADAMRAKGLQRAPYFNWNTMALQTAEVYRKALA
jgi:glycosyltransferase involved in cell wall biosynthesis